jgi:hypothetical protein
MNKAHKQIVLALVLGMVACPLANGQRQTRFSPPTARAASGGSNSGGGYISGGERGSVVQVIRDAEVQAELNLNNEQQQQVSLILQRVKATEDELFGLLDDSFARDRERDEQAIEKAAEARQQLARASRKILEQLTPFQRRQLQVLCRQAATDEAAFQARMMPRQGGGGFGGRADSWGVIFGSGDGSTNSGAGTTRRSDYSRGGGPGGIVRVISYDRVQEQLGLSAEQRLQIAEITGQVSQMETDLFAELQSSHQVPGPGNEQFEQQRQKEESARQAVVRAGEEIMRQLTPAQQTRLRQICLQVQGAEALFKPEIIKALGLTAPEQIKLASMRQETERQTSAIFLGRNRNTSQAPSATAIQSQAEQVMALWRDTERRMLTSVLTPAQQTKLKEMQGKESVGAARLRTGGAWAGSNAGVSSSSGEQLRRP